jgi:hypothetical protein
MKKKSVFNAVLAIVLVFTLTLAFVACDTGGGGGRSGTGNTGGTGGGGSGGGNTITDGNIVSGAPVTYNIAYFENAADMENAKKETNFNYLISGTAFDINDYMTSSSVTINDGKITIKLGIPLDDSKLQSLDNWAGVNASPKGAKFFGDDKAFFCTSNAKYFLLCAKDAKNYGALCYVDRDVTLTGTFNTSMKKGWNYWISSLDTNTAAFTTSMPNGFSWIVVSAKLN